MNSPKPAPPPLIDLYAQMYLIRHVEEAIADAYPKQEMRCPVHLCIGQEATAVGVCAQLRLEDSVFSTHRSHGHYLAKGGNLDALLGELYGRKMGCSAGKGGSMHLIDLPSGFLGAAPILGATVALAVGAAFGHKMKRDGKIAVAFFGDAAAEEGIFYEVANFAALHKLPIVMVCENNGLSTLSPLSVRQPPGRSISQMVEAIGVRAASGDGNDLFQVLQMTNHAVELARLGHGPSFLEFSIDRWREHCGPGYDQTSGYRPKEDLVRAQARDPVLKIENHLLEAKLATRQEIELVRERIHNQVAQSFAHVQASPLPDASELMTQEYAP